MGKSAMEYKLNGSFCNFLKHKRFSLIMVDALVSFVTHLRCGKNEWFICGLEMIEFQVTLSIRKDGK